MTSNSGNNVLAICSGPIITTWDCHHQPSENSIEELKANGSLFQFEPFENHHNITDFTWNHNGNVIASCCREGKVVLSNARNGGVLDSIDQNLGNCCSVSLKGTGVKSRYLCLTDFSNDISIWDLKKKSRARKFNLPQGHAPTAFIDPTDTYVVAISSTQAGSIYLYHLRQGKLHHTYTPTNNTNTTVGAGSTCAHGSPLHHSLMAVGTTNGTVYLWDISKTQQHTHYTTLTTNNNTTTTTAVAAVEFSPHHANVVVSCLGDQVEFYDTQQSNMIQSIKTNVESDNGLLTSCTFSTSEPTLAVGTSSGNVLLYDLRQTSTSISSFSLDAKITQMQFANTSTSTIKTTAATPKNTATSTITSSSSSSSTTSKKATTDSNNKTPIMEKKIPSVLKSIQEQQQDYDEDETIKIPKIKSTMKPKNDTDNIIVPSKSFDKISLSTTTTTTDKVDTSKQNSDISGIYKGPSPFPTTITNKTVVTNNKTLVKNLFQTEKQPKEEASPQKTISIDNNHFKFQSSYTDWKKSPERLQQPEESGKEDEGEENYTPPTTNTATTRVSEIMMISKDEVETIVEDCVYDLRDDMDKSLRNLHIDILKQFQQQTMEMKSMFRQQEELIHQILEENKLLRHQLQQQQQQQQQLE